LPSSVACENGSLQIEAGSTDLLQYDNNLMLRLRQPAIYTDLGNISPLFVLLRYDEVTSRPDVGFKLPYMTAAPLKWNSTLS